LEALAGRWQKGKLLNVGCGHGADFLPFKDGFELYGIDFSAEMIKLANKYSQKHQFKVNLQTADARKLPFPDETFDWAISVATYHHIQKKEERVQAYRELKRVLKPGGEAFITVWNRCQTRFWFKGKEVMVPWKSRDVTLNRYYYLYTYPEFEREVRKAGLKILRSFAESSYHFPWKYFSRNICLLVKKEN
jgi:tRNA (uracil-5-)-methyltransferase TRM9